MLPRCALLQLPFTILVQGFLLGLLPTLHAGTATHDREAEEFFNNTNLQTFKIELPKAEYDQLSQRPRTYVRGRVRIGEQVWENVGIRLKGSGTFQPISDRPSMALKFNWKEDGQRFSGLTKLFLENSGQDASRLCKFVANGVFADGGIPAPRITHARVWLNDNPLGLYVVAEAVNKDFLRRQFGNNTGNLYEAFFSDVNRGLKQANGPPGTQADLRDLGAAAAIKDEAQRKHGLNQLLDTEEFLDFLAIEMILANWDGYAFHQNNYRLYHDPASGRIKIIPHDLDNTFSESGMSLMPPRNGILTAALLAGPADRHAFRERVARLFPRVLDSQSVQSRIRTATARLSQGATPEEQSVISQRGALLERRIKERWRHFGDELASRHPAAPTFDSGGIARLSGWEARTDWNDSKVALAPEDGASVLRIEASGDYCFGSWRLPVWLSPGRYRLEGETRTQTVVGLPSQTGSGAGVRVLGGRRGTGVQGDCNHWVTVRHDFNVQEGCEWVELIAELRAVCGTACFDPATLQLVRLR